MPSEQPCFTVVIPSELAAVCCARAFLVAVCKAHGLNSDTTDGVALAVHEALTNVIRHAHQHRPELPIQMRCYPGKDRIEVHIIDQGDPFDIAKVPDLDPAELRLGGRGVFLMRALFDELTCDPRPESGNHLRLVKHCCTQSPRSA